MDGSNKRKVCVFTGSRVDYGPALPLLRRLRSDSALDLKLLVSGGHLVPDQGLTYRQIESDGFIIDELIDVVLSGDRPVATAKSFGMACLGYSDALKRIDPDILIVLGDRYEALAVAVCCLVQGIVIAHVGGGQLSRGSIDNQMRNAISKLAHLHFTVSAADTDRLVLLGEDRSKIQEVGMPGIDSGVASQLLDRKSLGVEIGIELESPLLSVTYHPATADPSGTGNALDGLLDALDHFDNATLVITAPNVDSGSRDISGKLREYCHGRNARAAFVPSLGQRLYLSLMRNADVVIGNSSSGINEAPLLGVPSVNIGTRQDGRAKASSVVDCGESSTEIRAAIARCLTEKFVVSPDEGFEAVDRSLGEMIDRLKTVDLANALRK